MDDLPSLLTMVLNPNDQVTELTTALQALANTPGTSTTAGQVAGQVVDALMERLSTRLGVGVDTLFPMRASVLSTLR